MPRLDLPIWRERAQKAGTARVSNYLWSDNNSMLGPVPEERLISASRSGSPRNRSPPKNNRDQQMRSSPSLSTDPARRSLSENPPRLHSDIEYYAMSSNAEARGLFTLYLPIR